jgi:hypothetical protein
VLGQLEQSLLSDKGREMAIREQNKQRSEQRLALVRHRLDQAYQDKLDGKITNGFWERKAAEWQSEEQQVLAAIRETDASKPERLLDAMRILELANKAYFLYLKQPPQEKAKLLRMVLSNCAIDAGSIYPTYRKPFDVVFQMAKNEEWCARRDSNSRPSASKSLVYFHQNLPERAQSRAKSASYDKRRQTTCSFFITLNQAFRHDLSQLVLRYYDGRSASL